MQMFCVGKATYTKTVIATYYKNVLKIRFKTETTKNLGRHWRNLCTFKSTPCGDSKTFFYCYTSSVDRRDDAYEVRSH